jgi:rubrerythrin
MPSVTTSAIISFAQKLEDDSSRLYSSLAELFVDKKEIFTSFSKESKENETLVTRTYRETVSDALETSFSFEGLNLNDYEVETTLAKDISYSDALKTAIKLEKKATGFYLAAAELSKSLLATIPRAFRGVVERRNRRKLKLESFAQSESTK